MSEQKAPEQNMTPLRWVFLGIAVGAGVVGLWSIEKNIPSFSAGDKNGEIAGEASHSDLLSVKNQPAGASIVIDAVSVAPPGVWVAVHEIVDGEDISVLGAARVRFPSTNVVVELLRNTKPGGQYSAVLYRDDGDDVFSLEHDSVYVDFESGKRVEAPFKTDSE